MDMLSRIAQKEHGGTPAGFSTRDNSVWRMQFHPLPRARILQSRLGKRCADQAGGHAVDPNVVRCQRLRRANESWRRLRF